MNAPDVHVGGDRMQRPGFVVCRGVKRFILQNRDTRVSAALVLGKGVKAMMPGEQSVCS